MSNETIILFFFRSVLVSVGVWVILNENKIARIERHILNKIKGMVKKWYI